VAKKLRSTVTAPARAYGIFFLLKSCFYLPRMEYEGSIGLVTKKIKKNLSDKNISVCHAPLPLLDKFGSRLQLPP
jgi:hypothetical protein